MWTISSDDVEQAKARIDHRRSEVEARYAAEKTAIEAEIAAIEALERVAAEFAQRHSLAAQPTALGLAAATIGTPSGAAAAEGESASPAEAVSCSVSAEVRGDLEAVSTGDTEGAGGGEGNLAFDILKPGSRWRLNRAARLLNPEGASATPSSTYLPSTE
jgi:hypothetical protein